MHAFDSTFYTLNFSVSVLESVSYKDLHKCHQKSRKILNSISAKDIFKSHGLSRYLYLHSVQRKSVSSYFINLRFFKNNLQISDKLTSFAGEQL